MASIAKVLKVEIQRIVQREIAQFNAAQKKNVSALKKVLVEHKRRIAALEKQMKTKVAVAQRGEKEATQAGDAHDDLRVTAKALKSMRTRLGITQAELASLLGVSVQVISVWEAKKGRVHIRKAPVRAALVALKQEKKADVCARLGKEPAAKKAARKRSGAASGGLVSSVDGAEITQLRNRLGISQQEFARLVGVSNQIVSVWERKQGPLTLRAATARQLGDVLKISKAEAKRRLG